jgi:hypothetical protein
MNMLIATSIGIAVGAASAYLWVSLLPPPPIIRLPDAAQVRDAYTAADREWAARRDALIPPGSWERFALWVAR